MQHIVTPVKVDKLQLLLQQSGYDPIKSNFLLNGFRQGFDIGYRGPTDIKLTAPNLRLTVGNQTELWNKVMSEVKQKRYAGPYQTIPFDTYIQSPIGLVPKDNGKKTRLIFHLSYPRNTDKSVNSNTPDHLCTVVYPTFDEAVQLCIDCGPDCSAGKSDLSAAFRHLCLNRASWRYLIMKAKSPIDNKFYFFVDKCMPFGAAISCAIFQAFSNALAHIHAYLTQSHNINYLDDFFLLQYTKLFVTNMLRLSSISVMRSIFRCLWTKQCGVPL